MLMEANNISEKATRGRVGLSAFTGDTTQSDLRKARQLLPAQNLSLCPSGSYPVALP